MDIKDRIRQLASEYAQDIITNRRYLHQHPELSFQEVNTSGFVVERLSEYGLEPVSGIAGTGIMALIEGKNPDKKVLALRADMDALPILEQNEVSYRSVNQGVMHACGHDVHTASLLGTARILSNLREHFEGTIKFIFQPGEEKAPGGASKMIEEGVLEDPSPKAILGQHVMPQIPIGKVGFKPGIYMASADEIYIRVIGKGGHAAMPDTIIDPVLIASHIIVALQQIVSRNANPKIPSVLSFGKITANGATNVIPDEVNIEGTFRTLDESWRSLAHEKMKRIGESIAWGMGAGINFEILKGYPFLKNHEKLTQQCRTHAIEYLGEDHVVDLDIWMAAEDFAFYSQQTDACFYRLGVGNPDKGIVSSVHTPTFNVDEDSLEIGAGLMAFLSCRYLEDNQDW
jgi:amidohydrolase